MTFHTPVLVDEVIEYLNIRPGEKYIDATVGGGGHTAAVLEAGGKVLAIDADPESIGFVRERFAAEIKNQSALGGSKIKIVQGNFKNIDEIAREHGFKEIAGILFDLGMSSWQMERSGRGFSFLKNEPLDMRVSPSLAVRAKDLLAALSEKELNELFSKFAQEKYSRAIARAVKRARRLRAIKTTQELSGILAWVESRVRFRTSHSERSEESPTRKVALWETLRRSASQSGGMGFRASSEGLQEFWDWYESTFSKSPDKFGSYDRRARIFQALRIAVNDELAGLEAALPRALQLLRVGGRLVVISFHSLEDKIVKSFGKSVLGTEILTKRPIRPSEDETSRNPRARSAKLRAFEKLS